MSKTDKKYWIQLSLLLGFSLILRLYFYSGYVFSDDAYYSFYALKLTGMDGLPQFAGYPVVALRTLHTGLTALAYMIIGYSKLNSIFFPLIFSLLSVIVVYTIVYEWTSKDSTALLAAFLYSIIPTDVIFSTLNFSDPQASFFIILGVLYLLRGYRKNNKNYAVLSGVLFAVSMLFKSSFFYLLVLISLLLAVMFLRNRKVANVLFLSLVTFSLVMLTEGIFYYFFNGDFFHRLTVINNNYNFTHYDFFPPYSQFESLGSYLYAAAAQVIYNLKSIFLRRFYIFIPLIAAAALFLPVIRKKYSIFIIWFFGLAVLFAGFTSSLGGYRPMVLKNSWYVHMLFAPASILAALVIEKINKNLRLIVLLVLLGFSIYMCYSYQSFFDLNNKKEFVEYISRTEGKIYTDHHTMAGLISADIKRNKGRVNTFKEYKDSILLTDIFIYNLAEIEELEKQGFDYKSFSDFINSRCRRDTSFGYYHIFRAK